MPNKIRLNIDFAKIQGAIWFTSPKTGEKCLVIVPSRSRMKHYPTKKEGTQDSLYGQIEIVPLKDGPNDREDTHWAVEPMTREERESRDTPRLPILGNAREYNNGPKPAAHVSSSPQGTEPAPIAADDDEIPF